MKITKLLITGQDGPAILFATTLTANEARVVKPGTSAEGEAVVGETLEVATETFALVRDLMKAIVGAEPEE